MSPRCVPCRTHTRGGVGSARHALRPPDRSPIGPPPQARRGGTDHVATPPAPTPTSRHGWPVRRGSPRRRQVLREPLAAAPCTAARWLVSNGWFGSVAVSAGGSCGLLGSLRRDSGAVSLNRLRSGPAGGSVSEALDEGSIPAVQAATAHPVGVPRSPSTASRARFTALASSRKSASTRVVPRTRARRPPCLRRIRWPILRSTLGRVAR